MSKTSLSAQRQAIEHCLAMAQKLGVEDTILNAARDGCLSLGWFDRRSQLIHALVKLDKDAPYFAELFQVFPGASISSVTPHEFLPDDNYEIGRDA
jgi:hypothetical protein